MQVDRSCTTSRALPQTLDGAQVAAWIEALSKRPDADAYDEQRPDGLGSALDDRSSPSLDAQAIPARRPRVTGWSCAAPTCVPSRPALRVFSSHGDTDIDRFQESALFPGTPVAIAHGSRDGKWWFVVSNTLCGLGREANTSPKAGKQQVFGYAAEDALSASSPAQGATVFTPEQPQVSELQLDMGVRVPCWPTCRPTQPVNGQHPYTSCVVELPVRDERRQRWRFAPALLPRTRTRRPATCRSPAPT